MQTSVNSFLTVYTAASWQYFINLELRTLSTWHSNQQISDGYFPILTNFHLRPLGHKIWVFKDDL
jgi:hypothetical protein